MQLRPFHRFVYQVVHRTIQKIMNEKNGRFPFNHYGFSGGGGQTPTVPAAPPIAPSPVPTETTPRATTEGRQQQVAMLKYGALATVSNVGGAGGIAGAGADFYPSMTTGTSARQTTGGN